MLIGHCLCGLIEYVIKGRLDDNAVYCHCSLCRASTGSFFKISATGNLSDFEWTRGDASDRQVHRYKEIADRHLCGGCGTHLITTYPGNEAKFRVSLGPLKGDFSLVPRPKAHIFVGSKSVLFALPNDGLPQYEEKLGSRLLNP